MTTTVKVKPLVWSHRNDQPAYEVCADCPFGRYAIAPAGEYGYGWKQPRQNVWSGYLPTCDEAKAAAQADYEARILSAVAPQAGDNAWPEEPTDDMIRALFTLNSASPRTTAEVIHVYKSLRNLASHPCTSTPVVSQNAPALEDKGGEVARLRHCLETVRANLVRLAWEENSVMIEGIDAALKQKG